MVEPSLSDLADDKDDWQDSKSETFLEISLILFRRLLFLTLGFRISAAKESGGISLIERLCLLTSSKSGSNPRLVSSSDITEAAPRFTRD